MPGNIRGGSKDYQHTPEYRAECQKLEAEIYATLKSRKSVKLFPVPDETKMREMARQCAKKVVDQKYETAQSKKAP